MKMREYEKRIMVIQSDNGDKLKIRELESILTQLKTERDEVPPTTRL
jgi:hypothetical protein